MPYGLGLKGHSDADVLVHAVIDALLGAACLGDIGTHFPDSDSQYAGISSVLLLERVRDMLQSQGFRVRNVDATVIAERPKLAAFTEEMRANIGDALGIGKEQVSVKATTSSGLGFTGRGEGIAAQAVTLIERR